MAENDEPGVHLRRMVLGVLEVFGRIPNRSNSFLSVTVSSESVRRSSPAHVNHVHTRTTYAQLRPVCAVLPHHQSHDRAVSQTLPTHVMSTSMYTNGELGDIPH